MASTSHQAQQDEGEMSFWDHLEELRGTLFRSILAICAFTILAFCFKRFLFDVIVLAPVTSDFLTYRLLGIYLSMKLVNIEISTQFFVHLKVAAAAGLVFSFPFIVYELWKFIAPALYKKEKKAVSKAFGMSTGLFYIGVLVGYYVVLPMCLNFFVDYKVSETVENTISLSSYISLFMSMVLMIGITFEFPTVIMVLSSMGLVTRSSLRGLRKHAIVVVLCISAIITPADPLSMIVLAIPLYALYEFSILCARKEKPEVEEDEEEEEEEEETESETEEDDTEDDTSSDGDEVKQIGAAEETAEAPESPEVEEASGPSSDESVNLTAEDSQAAEEEPAVDEDPAMAEWRKNNAFGSDPYDRSQS